MLIRMERMILLRMVSMEALQVISRIPPINLAIKKILSVYQDQTQKKAREL